MFQNVQKKLTALYVLTAGVILTAALGITAVFLCQMFRQQQEKLLLSNISNLISRLQTSNRHLRLLAGRAGDAEPAHHTD